MTLMDARTDRVYKVIEVGGSGNERRRLLDMGFTPDCKIYVAGSLIELGLFIKSICISYFGCRLSYGRINQSLHQNLAFA